MFRIKVVATMQSRPSEMFVRTRFFQNSSIVMTSSVSSIWRGIANLPRFLKSLLERDSLKISHIVVGLSWRKSRFSRLSIPNCLSSTLISTKSVSGSCTDIQTIGTSTIVQMTSESVMRKEVSTSMKSTWWMTRWMNDKTLLHL